MQKRADLARPCGYQQILLKDLWTMQPERRQTVDVTTDSPCARFRIRASRFMMGRMRRALRVRDGVYSRVSNRSAAAVRSLI
jgi:hypothetical protein